MLDGNRWDKRKASVVGFDDGNDDGWVEGSVVGWENIDGLDVGRSDGCCVGCWLGWLVGMDGREVGWPVGTEGFDVGTSVGCAVGCLDGSWVGSRLGWLVGMLGLVVGCNVGCSDGRRVGWFVGWPVGETVNNAVTSRTTKLPLSAMYRLPMPSTAMCSGPLSCALRAGKLSPPLPPDPVPAYRVTTPPDTRYTAFVSAMNTLPNASAASPDGLLKLLANGAAPSVAMPAVPVPAKTEMTPVVGEMTRTTGFAAPQATYTRPDVSTARATGAAMPAATANPPSPLGVGLPVPAYVVMIPVLIVIKRMR